MSTLGSRGTTSTRGTATSGGPKFLVIEDDISFQKLIRTRLTKRWPKAQVVMLDPTRGRSIGPDFDGDGADLVILDYQIGDLNGLDLMKAFRKKKGFPPVIMITGAGDENLAVAVIRAGAADYLSKQSLDQDTLVQAIEKALSQAPDKPAPAPPPDKPSPLPKIEGYEVLEQLGRGKAGTVYRAKRDSDGLEVALKVIRAELTGAANDELIDRCMREFTLMQGIDSPRVARIHEQRFTDDGMITAMELLHGGSLKDFGTVNMRNVTRALRLAREVALALSEIHAAGIVHRDLKPSNIMQREGSAVLVDFGVAREIEGASTLTRAGAMLGTPAYVSPEQAQGLKVDPRTDLYSLGVILFELLMGEPPYKALTTNAVIQKHVHAPLPELPVDLWLYQGLIDRLMAKSPDDRYPDAAAFIKDLDGLTAGTDATDAT